MPRRPPFLIALIIIAIVAAIGSGVHEWRSRPIAKPPARTGEAFTGRPRVVDGDSLELAGDPDEATVGKTIRDPVLTADSQIDVCVNTLDILWSPPVLELCGPRPRVEEALGRGADRLSNDKPHHSPST